MVVFLVSKSQSCASASASDQLKDFIKALEIVKEREAKEKYRHELIANQRK